MDGVKKEAVGYGPANVRVASHLHTKTVPSPNSTCYPNSAYYPTSPSHNRIPIQNPPDMRPALLVLLFLPIAAAFLPPLFAHGAYGPHGQSLQTAQSASLLSTPPAPITVSVPLSDDREYPIYIGSSLLSTHTETLASHVTGRDVLVVTNDRISPIYLDNVCSIFEKAGLRVNKVVLPDGEENKKVEVIGQIWDAALEHNLDRKATFVALGGGVIGDMVGFAAATYQRGVNFIQVPTTVMAMVDSSVGGKTGVNHPMGKNMIGSFHQVRARALLRRWH